MNYEKNMYLFVLRKQLIIKSRDMIIDQIIDKWYNSKVINNDIIYKSFSTSENNLFKGFDSLQQKIVIDEDKDNNGKTVEDTIDENELLNENE